MKTISLFLIALLLVPVAAGAQVLDGGIDAGTGINATVQVNTSTETTPADAQVEGEASANSEFGDFVSNSAGVYITAAAQVQNEEDLDVMVDNLFTSHEQLASVNASKQNQVTASYRHNGRVLGIFPVVVKSSTIVALNANGQAEATTSMPWWNFFVLGTGKVSSSVNLALESNPSIAVDLAASADAAARARVLEAVVSAHASLESGS